MGLKYQDSPIFGRFGGGILPKAALAVPGRPWVWSLGLFSPIFFLHIHKQTKKRHAFTVYLRSSLVRISVRKTVRTSYGVSTCSS